VSADERYHEVLLEAAGLRETLDASLRVQKMLTTERDQARADLRVAIEERERLRGELENRAVISQERLQLEGLSLDRVLAMRHELQLCRDAVAERDRLRAVLAETPGLEAYALALRDAHYFAAWLAPEEP
jgi:hypothetical protein